MKPSRIVLHVNRDSYDFSEELIVETWSFHGAMVRDRKTDRESVRLLLGNREPIRVKETWAEIERLLKTPPEECL